MRGSRCRHRRCAQRGGHPAADRAKIEPLDDVVAHAAAGLASLFGRAAALAAARNLSPAREGPGRVSVVLDLAPTSEVEIAIPGGFRVDPRIRAAVKSLPGIVDVHDI